MEDLLSTLSQATGAPMPAQPAQQGAAAPGQMTPAQAIAQLETGGAPATSTVSNPASSAQGRMQVLGGTNSDPGFGVRPGNGTPADRARVGEDYLNAMTQRYGNPSMGALAYTWGPGNVDKWLASGADPSKVPADKMQYVQRFVQMTGGGASANPAPTTPGQSYSGQQPSGYTGPTSDLMSTLQGAMSGEQQPQLSPAAARPTLPPEACSSGPTSARYSRSAAARNMTGPVSSAQGLRLRRRPSSARSAARIASCRLGPSTDRRRSRAICRRCRAPTCTQARPSRDCHSAASWHSSNPRRRAHGRPECHSRAARRSQGRSSCRRALAYVPAHSMRDSIR